MESKIIKMIAKKLGKKEEEVKLTSNLIEDLGADSLDVVEMIMDLEDEFGITLPDEEVSNMKTIQDVINYIKKVQ